MFVFMGSYSGGDYDSSGDDDSQDKGTTDDHTQTGVDDYTGDEGGNDSGQDSSSGAGTGPAVGPGGSTGGGGVITEPPRGDDPGDSGEAEEGEECEDEGEKQPDAPDAEEPDTESEDDVDQQDHTEEDTEEEENDDEDEEEDDTVVVVQEVDALSAMSWGVQPVMKHVEECYGEEMDLFYKPAPARELDPQQEKQKWIDASKEVDMPVDPSFWDNSPPESTELVNRAFEAAIQQRRGIDYIRALWRRGVAGGRDFCDREALIDLALDLGMNPERFEEDLEEVQLESGGRDELPFTFMEIHGAPVPKTGRVRYSDFRTQFTFQGIDEQEPQELQGFVEEHGPVATSEVMEVYGIRRQEAIQRLEDLDNVSSFEVGGERFWTL